MFSKPGYAFKSQPSRGSGKGKASFNGIYFVPRLQAH